MTVANNLVLEIMDTSNAWQDRTADCKHITISSVGLAGQRYGYPQTGRAVLTMNNINKTYSPSQTIGQDTGATDARRRVRIRTTTASQGKELQAVLTGTAGVGGTTTPTTSKVGSEGLNSTNYAYVQSFQVDAGVLSQFTLSINQPVGRITAFTWQVVADDPNQATAGTGPLLTGVLASGTGSFPNSAGDQTATVSVGGSVYLQPNTWYWLYIYVTAAQAGANQTNLYCSSLGGPAPYGKLYSVCTGCGSVFPWQDTRASLNCTITTTATVVYWSQVVSTATTAGDVWNLQYDARAQLDSFANVDSIKIVTSAESSAATYKTYTNKWKTYTYSFTTGSNATTVEPRFAPQYAGNGFSSSGIEYRNVTLKKGAGSDVLTNGNFSTGAISPWAAHNSGGNTLALSVTNDYYYLYQGFIEKVQPSPGLAGDLQTIINCVDWVEIFKLQNINTVLQESKTADQLMTYALTFLSPLTFNVTVPGKLFDTGLTTIDRAFDTNTQNVTSILQVLTDAAMSEYGRSWVDRDGTVRFYNRTWLPNTQLASTKLTLGAAQAWTGSQSQPIKDIATIINSAVLTWHPRTVGGSTQILATATAAGPIAIPGVHTDGTAGTTSIALTYHDATGRVIGGKNQIDPVANTDYTINESSDGHGVDYTSSARFSITSITHAASQTSLTLNNTATGPLYATLLQVRGNPVTIYDPVQIKVTDATSISLYQERAYTKDLLYGNDQAFATSLAQWLVSHFKYPFVEMGGVIIDNSTATISTELLSLEMFDLVSITDSQTNITSMKHVIVGINYELDPTSPNYIQRVEFTLERIDQATFFILDDATYGELDSATNLLYI